MQYHQLLCVKHVKKSKAKLLLLQKENKRNRLAECLILRCGDCNAETQFFSSKQSVGKSNGSYDINRQSVVACNAIKGRRQTLANFLGIMNLPPPISSNSYTVNLKVVEKAAKEVGMKCMLNAVSRTRDAVLTESPELIDEDPQKAIPVAVSIDGTWQKRGFSSKYGVVFVISVDTGEVPDYELLSMFCHECKTHQNDDKHSHSYKEWKRLYERS